MSFGSEDIDRYIVVYKKEHAPTEDEIFARRNGERWNADTEQKYIQKVYINLFMFFDTLILHFCRGLKRKKQKNNGRLGRLK